MTRTKQIVAIKNVSVNEPYFVGAFPCAPIMPGVLVVEAMAQAGGALLLIEFPTANAQSCCCSPASSAPSSAGP